MKSVLSKATSSQVVSSPFPYIYLENAIDDDLCEALVREFPANPVVAQGQDLGDNKRFSLSAPFVSLSQEVSSTWKEFIALHASQSFFDEFVNIFKSQISNHYPDLLKNHLVAGVRNQDDFTKANVLLDAQICINTPVISRPSSVKIAHIDDVDKLYAGLFYLRHPDDDSQGGNLEIYKTKSGSYKVHGPRLVDPTYVEVVKTIPYKKNSLILFLNSPLALHGVTVRSKTDHTRKFMNLVSETKLPLFELESRKENLFDKVSRKIFA